MIRKNLEGNNNILLLIGDTGVGKILYLIGLMELNLKWNQENMDYNN